MLKRTFTLLALSLFATAFATTSDVHAQPATQPASDAPAPAYGKQLSQINGTPIKVGEHNEYYYDNKRFNLSINPLGLMLKWISVSGSVAVSNHVAVRGDLGLYSDNDSQYSTMTLGTTLYFKKMYSGFFVEPGLGFVSSDDGDYDYDHETSNTEPIAQVITGWHWSYDSGLNVMAGFGLSRELGNNEYGDDVLPTGVFKVGYAF